MSTSDPITVLDTDDIWALLATARFGRLAVSIADQPEIFPVNFVAREGELFFRTAEGTKLFGAVVNPAVAFEVDDYTDSEGWSIVVKGTARVLETEAELAAAPSITAWVPTVKTQVVAIGIESLSGRRFAFGDEPSDEL
ncbi:pyridoxamine 5'-phosphate oxidase family protein [Mycetocola reblochoni]|uniref:Uncharacterized protein n=2 Tax=Mycetocola reblochoni TaxID=331618 RepID=A0A1R4ISZ9_9MICO|nr:pyridoxamine 5'-phosphate oxidase family protein [Mycetocola reblochoni]RLP71068.1 pyridoxamine 5'-phosphate oxidase family protein [Mycetocola reblochoni]SJN22987.1 hypothetical protein FM119_03410 [Mycetocola reblochoni REB411]